MAEAKVCIIEGCDKKHYCRGWCEPHYQRWRKHGDPLGGKHYFPSGLTCIVDGCNSLAESAGMCSSHRHKKLRYGTPFGGAAWKKGQAAEFIKGLKTSDPIACVIWPFFIGENGYGHVAAPGFSGTHRYVCSEYHGSAPGPDFEAAHSCGNRSCVNPHHLRWATRAENMADRIKHGTCIWGEMCHNAKLTADLIIEIREMRGSNTLKKLSEQFGVSISTISRVCRREVWGWV